MLFEELGICLLAAANAIMVDSARVSWLLVVVRGRHRAWEFDPQ